MHTKYTHKLDMPGHDAIYLGISPSTGGYILWDLNGPDASIVTSSDVRLRSFDESLIFHEPVGNAAEDMELVKHLKPMHTHEGDASFVAIDTSLRLPPPNGKRSTLASIPTVQPGGARKAEI